VLAVDLRSKFGGLVLGMGKGNGVFALIEIQLHDEIDICCSWGRIW